MPPFKLIEFTHKDCVKTTENVVCEDDDHATTKRKIKRDKKSFVIQLFGINEEGKTCSIIARDFTPFFYIKVPYNWGIETKTAFVDHLRELVGEYYEKSIVDAKLIKRKKLYGFDGNRDHKFVVIKFKNMQIYYKLRNLWYSQQYKGKKRDKKLIKYTYAGDTLELYEANIPPLLRFFHIREISPSGWITIPNKYKITSEALKTTHCDYEYDLNYKNIVPMNDKETSVPYKICSFDIEASSSHGDFPLPKKTYKKLAQNIIAITSKLDLDGISDEDLRNLLVRLIETAFGFNNEYGIDTIYTKRSVEKDKLDLLIQSWIDMKIDTVQEIKSESIEALFNNLDYEDELSPTVHQSYSKKESSVHGTVSDLVKTKKLSNEDKINKLDASLTQIFPPVEGDKVTFIGSTFTNYGEEESYLNHCIVLDTCDNLPNVDKSVIESYETEKDVLLAWTKLIQREDPDIIIGYNIFGFDYPFMFQRAKENNCAYDFLKMSRNKNELCGTVENDELKIEQSSIVIASGQHDLHFIKMPGRLQIDLYNYFRRSHNLEQYKLDYVSGYFIGDGVSNIEKVNCNHDLYKINSKNLAGLRSS